MNRIELATLERTIRDFIDANPELADDEELRADMLEGELDIDKVLARLVRLERETAAMAGACETQAQELTIRRDRFALRGKAFRAAMLNVMGAADLRKFELPQATISVRSGQPSVVIVDENALPENVIRIKREPNKTAIKEALIGGHSIPGATLSNGAPSLAIRSK